MASSVDSVFFDLGDTLGSAELEPASGRMTAFRLFPFVSSLLRNISQQGVRVGIISNTGKTTGAEFDVFLGPTGLREYVDPNLCIYSADVGLTKDTPEIFRLALERAGIREAPERAIYVGEDACERVTAQQAGFRVCPHPLLVSEVRAAEPLRFVRVTLPPRGTREEWFRTLASYAFVPMHMYGQDGRQIYGITSERVRGALSGLDVAVDALGDPDLPGSVDFFLLRDDAASRRGFAESPKLFARGDGGLVLASRFSEHLIALPVDRSLDEFHFDGACHGHAVKLVPDPLLLEPLIGTAVQGMTLRSMIEGIAAGSVTLTPEEKEHLGRITAHAIVDGVERYSGYRRGSIGRAKIASRHVAHEHNGSAVEQLVADLKAISNGRLVVRLHPFAHRGCTLHNVEAELLGTSEQVVLVTAHLDSTAIRSPDYNPKRDDAPGADDDASGSAAVVTIAERFVEMAAEQPVEMTVRFVLFNAEEHGRIGSLAYARLQRSLNAKIVAVFQMDMIGFNRRPPATWEIHAGCRESADIQERSLELADLAAVLSRQVAPALERPVLFGTGDPAACRSDHSSFHMYGYAACVSSERFFGGTEADGNPNYHRREDRVDAPGFDARFAADIARSVAASAWVLARG